MRIRRITFCGFVCLVVLTGCLIVWNKKFKPDLATIRDLGQKATDRDLAQKTTPLRMRNNDPHFFDMHNCSVSLGKTLEEDLDIIRAYPTETNPTYIKELHLNSYKPFDNLPDIPVFVTASNSEYHWALEGILKHLNEMMLPKFPQMKLIVYDLGLNPNQRAKVEKNCKCELRSFPFDKLPPYVKRLKEYRWKPILLQYVLQDHPFIFYIDADMRLTDLPAKDFMDLYFRPVKQRGMFLTTSEWPVTHNTDKELFAYLNEPPCAFKNKTENQAGVLLLVRTEMVEFVMDRWVACALHPGCMNANGHGKLLCGPTFNFDVVGRCHRYDQSFFSLVTHRLFHLDKSLPEINGSHFRVGHL